MMVNVRENMKTLKIKKMQNDLEMPKVGTVGAAGIDFYQPDSTVVGAHQTVYVSLGVAVEIPKGYMLMLAPRSSMSKTPLIMPNSVGIIDSDYRGEIKAILHNNSDDTYLIRRNDRLVQGILVPIESVKIESVEVLSETERGNGGIGSTGR